MTPQKSKEEFDGDDLEFGPKGETVIDAILLSDGSALMPDSDGPLTVDWDNEGILRISDEKPSTS